MNLMDNTEIEYIDGMTIAGELAKEILTDDVDDSSRIVNTYNGLTEANRQAVNDIFISLCGYQLTTLVKRFKWKQLT